MVSISVCHAEDWGSIPYRGDIFFINEVYFGHQSTDKWQEPNDSYGYIFLPYYETLLIPSYLAL